MNPITTNSVAQVSIVRGSWSSLPIAMAVAVAGCSSSHDTSPGPGPSSSTSSAAAAAPSTAGAVGISPGGVTTSLSAPAGSTEEEYYQACHWARLWISEHGGDPHEQIEAYLAMVQASPGGENGTWHTPWTQLTPERQAALIVAVKGAADAACD